MLSDYNRINNNISQNIQDFLAGKSDSLNDITNEESAQIIRDTVSIEKLKEDGIFFTGDSLSCKAAAYLTIDRNSKILDPTCGNGNLLLSVIEKLPKEEKLSDTLCLWGNMLFGFDLISEFIETVKLRIIIRAINISSIIDITDLSEMKEMLPNIIKGNIYDNKQIFENISHVLMNPPFINQKAEKNWATGNINSAALIYNFCLENALLNTQIVAILPDVLRAGSRYEKWRKLTSSLLLNLTITAEKKFDKQTNVDVFILNGRKEENHSTNWPYLKETSMTLKDFFDISVGPYVPYRATHEGDKRPYIFPLNLKTWETTDIENITSFTEYDGTLFLPPLIAIRRTSSPKDKYRASASLVLGKKQMVVENHLIICKPKDNKLETCEKLFVYLKSKKVNDFLNERIRCRHLTVTAVKEIPVGDLFNE